MKIGTKKSEGKATEIGRVKPKKELTRNEKKRRTRVTLILTGLAVAVICFLGLVILQDRIITEVVTTPAIVARKDIPQKTNFTADNFDEYFSVVEIDIALKSDSNVTSREEIIGQTNILDISNNEVISKHIMMNTGSYIGELKHPAEISFLAEGIDQVVAGTVRAGDKIDIWRVEPEAYPIGEYVYDNNSIHNIISNAYVSQVYTSGGAKVDNDIESGDATMITILVEREDTEALQKAFGISEGTLRITLSKETASSGKYILGGYLNGFKEGYMIEYNAETGMPTGAPKYPNLNPDLAGNKQGGLFEGMTSEEGLLNGMAGEEGLLDDMVNNSEGLMEEPETEAGTTEGTEETQATETTEDGE